jgi:anti-repressor protein
VSDLMPLQAFAFEGHDVRVITIDSEPWWVAADVCAVLGIERVAQAVGRLDPEDACQTGVLDARNVLQSMWMINESGLYDLIIRSDKPAARPFRRWVTSEVLPTIRREGRYQVAPTDPLELLKTAVREIEEARGAATKALERADHAEERLAEREPLAESYEKYLDARGLMSVGTAARILGTGQNRLFTFLRTHRVLISHGDRYNLPYQNHMDLGRFDVKAGTRPDRDGNEVVTWTTMLTAKGFEYVSQLIGKHGRP